MVKIGLWKPGHKKYSWRSRQQTNSWSQAKGAFGQNYMKSMRRMVCALARLAINLKSRKVAFSFLQELRTLLWCFCDFQVLISDFETIVLLILIGRQRLRAFAGSGRQSARVGVREINLPSK